MAFTRTQVQHGNTGLALSTLGAATAATGSLAIDASRTQGVKLMQFKGAVEWNGKTAGEGPLVVGLSIDLSSSEVAEAIIADPQHVNDVPATEQGNRKVYPLFTIARKSTDGTWSRGAMANDDAAEHADLKFPWRELTEGQGIQFWVFNRDASALTTGTEISLDWDAVQEWLRD